jgi:transcriptional regulator with XRE-family HTH domain
MPRHKPSLTDTEVGARVRALRIQRGLSQTVLADALGLSYQQLQKYETGINRIAPSRLAVIASALRVPVAMLFGEDGKGHPVEVYTGLNSHTRRELVSTLDKIESVNFERILLAMAIDRAGCVAVTRRK